MTKRLKRSGEIKRIDNGFLVRAFASSWALDFEGVVCENPDAPEGERIYRKEFKRKRIYLPKEYDRATNEVVFAADDNFVVSMNGYSKIDSEQCRRYGVEEGAYEEACYAIMCSIIKGLREKFDGVQLRIIDGAAEMGVDFSIRKAAQKFNIPTLGFSCPEFMLYVKDDDTSVYVAKNKDEYADKYIQTLDLLITTGGRAHALQHDVLASCIYGKRIHFVDVLNTLSRTGGVPATITNEDGNVKIDNAAAAFGRNISFMSSQDAIVNTPLGGDKWDALFANVQSVATGACREKMSPARKFSSIN